MFKKIVIIVIFLFSNYISAQCAMCKAVIEGGGNESVAEGVNNGITYLMVFPYFLIGVLLFLLYRHRKKNKKITS